MDNKPSVRTRIMTILIILAVVFVFIFVMHNCWRIHSGDTEQSKEPINVERYTNEGENN